MMKVLFSFGNHMHWNDMEWMWGLGTLANSVQDMLDFMDATGAKGAINFDALGYRYLSTTAPDLMDLLKKRIVSGDLEIASGSFAQPYGHLLGEESNVQQFIQGIEICQKTLGTKPTFWWEEEFIFFPQLPQLLRQMGYTGASLFFQETWHTPILPQEERSSILWEGVDGTTIPTLAYTHRCIHQWPEHLESLFEKEKEGGLFLQWLELMDSPQWMCRCELIAPVMQKWREKGVEIEYLLPSTYLTQQPPSLKRMYDHYALYQGISLGKNGDQIRRDEREVEYQLLDGQIMALSQLVIGKHYPQWSEYPSWEFQQGWDDLMTCQAHDMDECEGFCGDIGKQYLAKARMLSFSIIDRYMKRFSYEVGQKGDWIVFNPLHWPRKAHIRISEDQVLPLFIPEGPGIVSPQPLDPPRIDLTHTESGFVASWDTYRYEIDHTARIRCGDSILHRWEGKDCQAITLEPLKATVHSKGLIELKGAVQVGQYHCEVVFILDSLLPYIQVSVHVQAPTDPVPGYSGGLYCAMDSMCTLERIKSDYPFGQQEGWPSLQAKRKYPKGHWMTSDKWYESISNPYTGLRFSQAIYADNTLAFFGKGTQGFFRTDKGFQAALYLYDPWDEANWLHEVTIPYAVALLSKQQEPEQMAQEFNRPLRWIKSQSDGSRKVLQAFHVEGKVFVSSAYLKDNQLLLRVWNQYAHPEPFSCALFLPFSLVQEIDPTGEVKQVIDHDGNTITLKLKPHQILTLVFHLKERTQESLDAYRHVWSDQAAGNG